MLHRLVALGIVVAASLAATVAPAALAEEPSAEPADERDPTLSVPPRHVEHVDGTLRFRVEEPGTLRYGGRHYYDTLELSSPGLLVNELSMDDYIAGIAEMPTRWPIEALKAQAVAARTYAWRSIQRGRWSGYDICATVACQVFHGADVVIDRPTGPRWREAVDATSGEVLLDDTGTPILARYFSTSGGRTYANEDVFPSDGSFDYLVEIEDPYDEASPLHRWSTTFTREQFDEILARGTTLSAVSPMDWVERVGDHDDPLGSVRVMGVNGRQVEVGATAFRRFVSQVAPSLFPDDFPGPRMDGDGTLPTALPSSRFWFELTGEEVTIQGQGWGHGVGMGQFGAMARAEDGHDYREILETYYAGLAPSTPDGLPDRIRVGMSTSVPVEVSADRRFEIHAGEQTVADDALGTWLVERDDDGWALTAPRGHGELLRLTPTARTPEVPTMIDAATVEVDVNKPVLLTLSVAAADGTSVLSRDLGVVEAGTHAYTWRFEDDAGERVEPGEYLVMLEGEDHAGATAGDPATVEVPEPAEPSPPPQPPQAAEPAEPDGEREAWTLPIEMAVVVGLLGLVLLAGSLILWKRR